MNLLQGWKTRLLALATVMVGVLDLIDPALLSTALGYGPQGRAGLVLGIGVAAFLLRQITKAPAPPLLPKKRGQE